eukprot:scaffold404462_cov37-Prasinocladus_malaysianus.AAC.1
MRDGRCGLGWRKGGPRGFGLTAWPHRRTIAGGWGLRERRRARENRIEKQAVSTTERVWKLPPRKGRQAWKLQRDWVTAGTLL